jgi:hypothetical protein
LRRSQEDLAFRSSHWGEGSKGTAERFLVLESDARCKASVSPSELGRLFGSALFSKVDNFSFFQVIPHEEFKIPDGQRHHRWRHQFRRLTPHKGALNGALCSRDLVITDVYDEILNSRTGGNSLGAMLNYRE